MQVTQPNQIHREMLGTIALNPWPGHDSSARQQMFGSHVSQALVVKGSTERRCQTGMEAEYGKYTFSIKAPGDPTKNDAIEIIKVLERYPAKIGVDAIKFNPQWIVIYENVRTKEVGIIDIRNFCSHHQYFGFEYKATEHLSKLKPGAIIPAGTILMNSPSVTETGGYKYGTELNMALMSHPAVSEDGILISRDVLKRFEFDTFETRVFEWGSSSFPLNLYGDEKNYKPFPDIGDVVRPDGILMCLRNYDTELAIIEQNIHSTMEIDHFHDNPLYAGGAGGKIIDIRINHDISGYDLGPNNINAQADKYNKARYRFYQEFKDEYTRLRKQRGENLRLSPEFHTLVTETYAVLDDDKQRLNKTYRRTPLDIYRIEFVVKYEITPTIGFKLTGAHGKVIE